MEDYRKRKSRLFLSARRKKRKATALKLYNKNRKLQTLAREENGDFTSVCPPEQTSMKYEVANIHSSCTDIFEHSRSSEFVSENINTEVSDESKVADLESNISPSNIHESNDIIANPVGGVGNTKNGNLDESSNISILGCRDSLTHLIQDSITGRDFDVWNNMGNIVEKSTELECQKNEIQNINNSEGANKEISASKKSALCTPGINDRTTETDNHFKVSNSFEMPDINEAISHGREDESIKNYDATTRTGYNNMDERSGDCKSSDYAANNSFCISYLDENEDKNYSDDNTLEDETNEETDCLIFSSENSKVSSDQMSILGRRIVDIKFFLQQIQRLNNHSPIGCNFGNMVLLNETRKGLTSLFKFKCNMCNYYAVIHSEDPENQMLDLNSSVVAGAMAIGCGFSQIEEFMSSIDMPFMSSRTYSKHHAIVSDGWEKAALKEMEDAGKEEVALALQRGHIDKDGMPILTVVADGSWSKRSYRPNYSALSGVAAIVGYYTGRVLFIGVRNKYCTICSRAKSFNKSPQSHKCFRNWDGSSTSMEANIIVEGFRSSVEMHGAVYGTLIADGDSSVYTKVLQAAPYPNHVVKKIECSNRLLRNYCNKLKEISTNTKLRHVNLRKKVNDNITRLRSAVVKAVEYRKSQSDLPLEKMQRELREDILNGPYHIFGSHVNCSSRGYFCTKTTSDLNIVPQLIEANIFAEIMKAVNNLADHSRSLIRYVNSNKVEQVFSKVAKFVGGKRINFSGRNSYQARCSAAVVAHNSDKPLYKLHKTLLNEISPGMFTKTLESKRLCNKLKRKLDDGEVKKRSKRRKGSAKEDMDYGICAMKPDMPPDVFAEKCKDFMKTLEEVQKHREEFERQTVLQSDCDKWIDHRRNMLTASYFGRVCNMRPDTSCKNLVEQMLYRKIDTEATKFGRHNERNAIEAFEKKNSLKVEKCGLFIDSVILYFGASPDGLIGENSIVEVKCPFSVKDMTPEEAILQGKVNFLKYKNGKLVFNTSNIYYFQSQGQLHITGRSVCFFIFWTKQGILHYEIQKDDHFWKNHMEEKLKMFYINCLLPEIVDSRKTRTMAIRDPEYIIKARERKEIMKKKQDTDKQYNDQSRQVRRKLIA